MNKCKCWNKTKRLNCENTGASVQKNSSRCSGLISQNLKYLAVTEGSLFAEFKMLSSGLWSLSTSTVVLNYNQIICFNYVIQLFSWVVSVISSFLTYRKLILSPNNFAFVPGQLHFECTFPLGKKANVCLFIHISHQKQHPKYSCKQQCGFLRRMAKH